MDFVSDAVVRNYLLGLVDLVHGPKNPLATSRVLGRTTLRDTFIHARKLQSTTKIIFSYVSPTIPNEILRNALVSNISILRFSPNDDLFGHLISWRRQVYCKLKGLPSSFLLQFNDKLHRILVTFDELTRCKCQKRGHKAEECTSTDAADLHDKSSNTGTTLRLNQKRKRKLRNRRG